MGAVSSAKFSIPYPKRKETRKRVPQNVLQTLNFKNPPNDPESKTTPNQKHKHKHEKKNLQ